MLLSESICVSFLRWDNLSFLMDSSLGKIGNESRLEGRDAWEGVGRKGEEGGGVGGSCMAGVNIFSCSGNYLISVLCRCI